MDFPRRSPMRASFISAATPSGASSPACGLASTASAKIGMAIAHRPARAYSSISTSSSASTESICPQQLEVTMNAGFSASSAATASAAPSPSFFSAHLKQTAASARSQAIGTSFISP